MNPGAAARAGRLEGEIVVDPRSRGLGRAGERAYPAIIVGLPTLVLCLWIFALKAETPIWDDAVEILPRLGTLPASAFLPFHGHLNGVPILLWGILPGSAAKLAALLVAHLALTVGTTWFLSERVGAALAIAIGLPLGLMGSAHYDLLVPFQVIFPLALLGGLVAVWASVGRERTVGRRLAVSLALLLSVASSNIGLFVILALGIWFVLERRWGQLLELALPAVLWLGWYLILGRAEAMALYPLAGVVPYTVVGLAKTLGGVAGVGTIIGFAVLAAAIAYVGRRPRPALLGFALTIVAFEVVLGLTRHPDTAFTDVPAASRYTYIVGFLAAFGLAAAGDRHRTRAWIWIASAIAIGGNLLALVIALPAYP